jgi:hypothetical protein
MRMPDIAATAAVMPVSSHYFWPEDDIHASAPYGGAPGSAARTHAAWPGGANVPNAEVFAVAPGSYEGSRERVR